MERGTDYPASEVNFEQSIVAPAVDYLLMAFELTERLPMARIHIACFPLEYLVMMRRNWNHCIAPLREDIW